MITILFLTPIIFSLILFIFRSRILNNTAVICYSLIHLAISINLYIYGGNLQNYFQADNLNILFLLITSLLFCGSALYGIDFLKHTSTKLHTHYSIFIMLFVFSLDGVVLSYHLGLLWVFVEATTLSSAFLIYFNRTKSALEATWKYIFICSIGIALALIGIILLGIGCKDLKSLFFNDLYNSASLIMPFWLKLSFPFILIGFGTKIGLAPVHAWLPDAHSEAPSPISALLSGALLNASFAGVLRVYKLMEIAHLGIYSRILFLIMGFMSIFVSAVFIIKIKNYKRMLAYSSIENMGIIAIGIGIGGIGLFAAMFHFIAHSLSKASLFLTSGNILHAYSSKQVDEVKDISRKLPVSGWLWMLGFLSISAFPPFSTFISEFLIIKAMFEKNHIITAVCFMFLLTIIIAAAGKSFLSMYFSGEKSDYSTEKENFLSYFPQIIFLSISLLLGLFMPDFLINILNNMVNAITKL